MIEHKGIREERKCASYRIDYGNSSYDGCWCNDRYNMGLFHDICVCQRRTHA